MGAESALGSLNIPFFIFVVLLLSYVIWSKFFNKEKLKIDNSNQLMDILSIFIFLMTSIIGAIIFVLMIIGAFSLNFDINFLYSAREMIFWIVGAIGTFSLILLINNTRNKKVKKSDLKTPSTKIIKNYIIIAIALISYLLTILFTPLKNFLGDSLLFSLFVLLFFIVFCWDLARNTLFEGKDTKILTKKNKAYLLTGSILIMVLSILLLPSIKLEEIQKTEFQIYDIEGNNQESFEEYKINFKIKNLGHIGSLPNLIVLDYTESGIKTNNSRTKNEFRLHAYVNSSKKRYFISSFSQIENFDPRQSEIKGIKDIQSKEGYIAVKFNREEFKKEDITNFELSGINPVDISSKDFSYKDNTGEFGECTQDNCSIKIEINNSLRTPVNVKNSFLENLNNRISKDRVKNCRFERIEGEYKFEEDIVRYDSVKCGSRNSCTFEARDIKNDDVRDFFRIHLSNNGEGVVSQSMDIKTPIEIKLTSQITC